MELPELAPLPSVATSPSDFAFRFEAFSDWPRTPSVSSPLCATDDSVDLDIDTVAHYRIRSGREIAIDFYADASPREIGAMQSVA
jgi:hypothetical protein